ncbi:MAG: sulfite exporter TauE/SafE family protein, partial [FCB group bacterium]|nr:sulfite exporter TauE/SafE family protein [FCB group bacterium]
MIEFPISGVETYWWLPLIVAFVVSVFASIGGLSGA